MIRKNKNKDKGKKVNAKELKRQVLKLFLRHPKKHFNAKQVVKKLNIDNSKDAAQAAIDALHKEGLLFPGRDNKFKIDRDQIASKEGKGSGTLVEGKVDMTRTGAGYIVCDGMEEDIYVPAKNLKGALNGDKVQVEVFKSKGRRRPEGKVKKVLERGSEFFLGIVRVHKRYGIVVSDNVHMQAEIYVELEDLLGAKDDEKVVVKITKWPTRPDHNPIGRVTSVLGKAGSNDIEMKSILIENGFNPDYPEELVAEAEALAGELSEEEIAKRMDFREVTTFTIDPDTAKDFDDALSIRYLEDGGCEVGVHIADVSHYVKPGSGLDKESYLRSTSVYLVDRVCPMLPERLSNELCSLRPNEDKCTFSAVFVFDENDRITNRWFGKTLIHSNRRFAYEEAQEILETGTGEYAAELRKLNQLAKKLRKKKFKNGAISFESDEVKFKLDEEGKPIDVYVKERKDAHLLIEDFMLLANKEVATFIAKKSKGQEVPFVYRVHDLPNMDKLADFARFALELGFKMDLQTPKQIAESFNNLAKEARTNETLRMLEPIAIRTMSKAVYTTDNIGHYGLGFVNYSHFTSPIRRYSDVLVHRLLEKNLEDTYRTNKEDLEGKCKHISSQERKAMGAERESIKLKQVEYVDQYIGQTMDGRISGMIERGIFVELIESKAEGMIGFDRLGDAFEIGDSRLKAVGKRTGKVLKMGDTIRVKIISTDLARRQIEMELVESDEEE